MTNFKFTQNSGVIKSNIAIKSISLTCATLLIIGITGCQSSAQPSTTQTTQTIQQTQQTSPVVANHASSSHIPHNSSTAAKPPFTEIPLITDANRPQSVPGFIPPSAIPESWRLAPITASETDSVYKTEWKKSEIGRKCPLLALPSTANSHLIDRSVRRANFSGGWGVAYDLPTSRSAYGVALSGVSDPSGRNSIWNDYYVYQDGTELTYGREGGDPNGKWLAYLTLGDNHCFYNIWSKEGKSHLEQIISELRVVKP